MSYISEIIPVPRHFPKDGGYRSEHLVNCRNKRQRYITKLNKAINTVAQLIVQNTGIYKINKSNGLLEVNISNMHKLTFEILNPGLNNKIKEQDLNICTALEFR